MSEELDQQLLEAAKNADFDEVKAAVKVGANVNARNGLNETPLIRVIWQNDPDVFAIVKYLVEQDADVNLHDRLGQTALICAVKTKDLVMTKYLVENGADVHGTDFYNAFAFTIALQRKKRDIVEYLFSRDGFLLSDLMPCPEYLLADTYKTYREKAISRVSELIYSNGIPYARTIVVDIEKILKTEKPKLTQEDIEMLQSLIKKIASKDWVGNAQVSCNDFDFPEMEV